MARVGSTKERNSQLLTDSISIGVLAKTLSANAIDAAIEATGKKEQRKRRLPARVVVYFVLAMCIWSDEAYVEVMTLLVQGLARMKQWSKAWIVPTDGGISHARLRLGSEPLEYLYRTIAKRLAKRDDETCRYRNWHLMAIDGTIFDLPDQPDNVKEFGRPGSSRGKSAFPQARVVGLAECGTHAIVDAVIGGTKDSEVALSVGLFSSLGPGDLLLADRGFYSYDLWKQAAATGADLLWRMKSSAILPCLELFDDGSYRSEVFESSDKKKQFPFTVRVIEYTLEGSPDCSPERPYRLITTIMDPTAAPAEELARLYVERWEIETTFGELKTTLRGAGKVLRSKKPDCVKQEIWAYLLVHYAIRALMYESTQGQELDPAGDRLSKRFALSAATSLSRRTFPPRRLARALRQATAEIVSKCLRPRRNRSCPRGVKRKMSKFNIVNRDEDLPQPPPIRAITIVPATRPESVKRKKVT